jgi:signal transduction histidine kinase
MQDFAGLTRDVAFLVYPGIQRLNDLSDVLIAVAYFLLPVVLVKLVRGRRDIPRRGIFFCFIALLVTGAITHVMAVAMPRPHAYWLNSALKAETALISLVVLVLLWRLMPSMLALPSRADVETADEHTTSVLESTTVCVMAMDSEWKVNYVNRNAQALLKVQGNMLGMTLWEAFPVDNAVIRQTLLDVMRTRQPAAYEKYYQPLDLSVTVQAHPWNDGGVVIFFSDVSEQKRMQHELDWERVTREQRIQVLARLSASIAHEMKNPLAIIHARASDLAELAEEEEIPRAEVAKTCASIVRTSDRAMRILRGLASLARQGSKDPMQTAEVREMVDQTIELVRGRYQTHEISLQSMIPDGLPRVECREVQIGQVLLNLLNNAFDAIDASPDSQRWVRVKAYVEEVYTDGAVGGDGIDWLQIDVIDGGPALSPEVRENLMEPFYTTKPLGGGIGIGLSVSRAIASDHGGDLALHECDGHTCFRLRLPVRATKSSEVAA